MEKCSPGDGQKWDSLEGEKETFDEKKKQSKCTLVLMFNDLSDPVMVRFVQFLRKLLVFLVVQSLFLPADMDTVVQSWKTARCMDGDGAGEFLVCYWFCFHVCLKRHGQLGEPTSHVHFLPPIQLDFQNVASVCSGSFKHTVFVTHQGTVFGVGSNAFRQIKSSM